MKKLILGLLIVLTMIMFMGCSVNNNNLDKQIYEKERIFSAKFDLVWDSVVETIMLNGVHSIDIMEKDSGFIKLKESPSYRFNPFTNDKNIVLLPNGYVAGFCFIKFNYTIYIKEIKNESTKVIINISPQLYENVFHNNWITSTSTGFIEKNTLDEIEKILVKKGY